MAELRSSRSLAEIKFRKIADLDPSHMYNVDIKFVATKTE